MVNTLTRSHLFPLNGKSFKRLDDNSGVVAVVNVDGRTAHPILQVVNGQRDVLRKVFVEDPNLAVDGGFGDAVAVVMEENALLFGVAS